MCKREVSCGVLQVVRMLEGAAEMPHAGAPPGMSMMMYEGSPFGGPTQNFDSALYSAEMRQQYPNGTATPSPASSYGAPRVGTGRTSSLGRAADYSPSRPLPSDVDIMGPGAYDMHMGMAHIDRVSTAALPPIICPYPHLLPQVMPTTLLRITSG